MLYLKMLLSEYLILYLKLLFAVYTDFDTI